MVVKASMLGEVLHKCPASGPGKSGTRVRRLLVVFAACCVSFGPFAAFAQTPGDGSTEDTVAADVDARAQRHWGSGMAYLDEGDYTRALEAFNKAYELSGRPRILLAIAVTHERRGDLLAAVAALDEYLRLSPEADNVDEITQLRAEHRAKYDDQVRRMQQAKEKEAAEAAPTVDATPTTDERTSAPLTPPPPARASQWGWTALGVGVSAGVAAAVSGLMATHKHNQLERGCGASLTCTSSETQSGRTMAWVSMALTGVSLVGFGAGIWLFVDETTPSDSDTPRGLHVGVNYRAAGLTSDVTWSF
jgi:hypothetical protein